MSSRPKIKNHFSFHPPLKCIYCGKTDVKLKDEHIIPLSLDGSWIFPKASCGDCEKITSRFEFLVARDMYLILRLKENFRSRRKKLKKYKNVEVIVAYSDGNQKKVQLDISKFPSIYPILELPPPGIMMDANLSETSPEGMQLTIMSSQEELNLLAQEYPGAEIKFQGGAISWSAFFRLLAKIAHGVTVGHFGDIGYIPLLPPLILGTCPHLSHFIGGKAEINNPQIMTIGDQYEVIINSEKNFVVVNIKMLNGRSQTYTVVSGYITDWNAFMTNSSHMAQKGKKEFSHGMRTRFMYIHEWVIWFVHCIRHFIERDYPKLANQWPLLTGYSFDAYAMPPSHYLVVLKSTKEAIPSGNDAAIALPHNDHPSLPPKLIDINVWEQWCRNRLALSNDQWSILLPVHDLGKSHNVNEERKLLSKDEGEFLVAQINSLIQSQLLNVLQNLDNSLVLSEGSCRKADS